MDSVAGAVGRLLDHDPDLGAKPIEQALPVLFCCSASAFISETHALQTRLSEHSIITSPILGQESREVRATRDFKFIYCINMYLNNSF